MKVGSEKDYKGMMSRENKPVVLIIDDEKSVRESTRDFLEDCNYSVLEAENGKKGLEAFEREKTDLVLIDLRMPEVDGLEVLWKIVERSPEIPAIVVSGAGDISDVIEALHLGAWDYLRKPIEDLTMLQHAIEKALERANLISENRTYQEHLEEEVARRTQDLQRTNAELEQTALALSQKKERLALVMEATNDGIWDWDIINNKLYASPRCNEILGFKAEAMAENAFDNWASGIHPDDRDRIMNDFFNHLEKKDLYNVTYRYLYKDGEFRWQSSWGKALFDEHGKAYRMVGAIRDITHRKQAEDERAKLQNQLQQAQKLEALGTLAGGIAHDFNNLLMGIQGRVSLMLIDKDCPVHHFEHLKGIESYVKSATDLTRQLLGFARGGKYEVRPSNMNELIKEQNRMFGRTNKEITIRGKYEKDLRPVAVDQGQIQQVLLNLYVNAAHAMPGGGSLRIQTENVTIDESPIKPFNMKPGSYVKISVSDNGVGMDKATKERIFEPFFTTKEMGRGTGLGLATVYGIIKNHGGFINVYSEKNLGTTFNIYLPASEGVVSAEDKTSGELMQGQGTVLLVDDEELVIDVGSEMIKSIGYEVLTAASGEEAVEVYKNHKDKIDMVILDMIMPDMGGGEAYDNLKEVDPNIKVLLSSGYSINGRAAEIIDRGCNGFIQKPFDLKGLSNKIVEVLGKD